MIDEVGIIAKELENKFYALKTYSRTETIIQCAIQIQHNMILKNSTLNQ